MLRPQAEKQRLHWWAEIPPLLCPLVHGNGSAAVVVPAVLLAGAKAVEVGIEIGPIAPALSQDYREVGRPMAGANLAELPRAAPE